MYPDLNDEPAQKQSNENYQSTATHQQQQKKKNEGEVEEDANCCILGAKIWVSIIGVISLLLGAFVLGIALYAKFYYAGYSELSATLPDGGIWMIFGFGVVLALCSFVLILSAVCYDKAGFKLILVVFAIILTLLLLLEIMSAGILVWGLGVITIPESSVGDAITDRLLDARAKAVNSTYYDCCVTNKPPYSIENITKLDAPCLWPNSADEVQQKCGSENVLECVCKSAVAYGAYFGVFVQSKIEWVAVVTIIFAVLLLFGIIATCTLICAKKKRKEQKKGNKYYHPKDQ